MIFSNFTKKILYKYLTPILLITALSLILSGLSIYLLNNNNLSTAIAAISLLSKSKVKEKITLENEKFLSQLNQTFDEELSRIESGIYYTSKLPYPTKSFDMMVQNLLRQEDFLEGVYITNNEQEVAFQHLKKNKSLNALLQHNIQTFSLVDTLQKGYSSGLIRHQNTPYILYACPLPDTSQQYLVGIINAQFISDQINDHTRNQPFHISILNHQNELIYNTFSCEYYDTDTGGMKFDIVTIAQEKEKAGSSFDNGLTIYNTNKHNWRNIYFLDGNAYETALQKDASILMKIFDVLQHANLTALILLITGMILIASFLAYLVARSITKPIVELTTATTQIAEGDFSIRVAKKNEDEVGVLTDSFNQMIQKLNLSRLSLQQQKKQIEQQAKELASSNADLENYAVMASHDLKEPIRMISSYIQLLERKYVTQLDDQAQTYIDFALDGSTRMQLIIEDLLTYSRIGKKKNLQKKPIDLNNTLIQVQKNLQQHILEKNAHIQVDTLPTVSGISTQMISLFQNLLSNAIKYVPENRTPRIHIFSEEKAGYYYITIKDNGIGIPPDRFQDVFAIFKRLHSKDEYEGTGIGLAICQKILDFHQGDLLLDSELGVGSQFIIKLPITPSPI